jgi:hypothetical protein
VRDLEGPSTSAHPSTDTSLLVLSVKLEPADPGNVAGASSENSGPATRETSVINTQTLYYGDSVAAKLTGSVTLEGDRLTKMVPLAF